MCVNVTVGCDGRPSGSEEESGFVQARLHDTHDRSLADRAEIGTYFVAIVASSPVADQPAALGDTGGPV